MTSHEAVPTNYMGVWKRELLETASSKDDTSLVLWMQTQQYHIDIRIPANCPPLPPVSNVEDYTNEELLELATQQGFAGITQVIASTVTSSDICQWHREIDFQPQTAARDIGKMVFTDENTVIETGLDSPYLELWRRLSGSQKPVSFTFVVGKNREGLDAPAYLMRAGKYVAYARSRNNTLPKADSLLACIQTQQPSRVQLLDWLDMEISFGEMLDGKHWEIKHSTLPFKEGLIVTFGVKVDLQLTT
jgi:Protein HRI1